ncbi:DUF4294 domain-containing protein [Flavobacterium sp.]|uniref:DUF4294 domain-containing protein n=1 Tax=Flavobacterium sp. TaxID=239 RepID=UPI0037537EF4
MKFLLLVFIISFNTFSQINKDSLVDVIEEIENDIVLKDTIFLQEVFIGKEKMDPEAKKQFLLLQNRVYKVYPFAKTAGERLSLMNKNLEKLNSNKEKKRYFKIIEDYMENEFKEKLKKLSRKQGQILVKLIYRQTGFTTFDLIKDYKNGWKAFWSNNTAKLFDINLKKKYEPFVDNEDYLIETILYRAFVNGRLVEQKSANPISLDELDDFWQNKK